MIDSEVTKRRDIILDDDISKNQYLKSILPWSIHVEQNKINISIRSRGSRRIDFYSLYFLSRLRTLNPIVNFIVENLKRAYNRSPEDESIERKDTFKQIALPSLTNLLLIRIKARSLVDLPLYSLLLSLSLDFSTENKHRSDRRRRRRVKADL